MQSQPDYVWVGRQIFLHTKNKLVPAEYDNMLKLMSCVLIWRASSIAPTDPLETAREPGACRED